MAQNIKPSEISEVLLQQLREVDTSLQWEEVGKVLQVSDGVVRLYGLTHAEAGELLDCGNGVMAVVMNLEEDNVGAVLLGPTDLVKEGNRYFVTPCGAKIEVAGEKGDLLNEKNVKSGSILLGVRPEHMKLTFEAGADTIPARLEVNEMMGSELHLHVFTADGTRWIVRVPTIDLTAQQRKSLTNGAQVYITFEGKVMHFFDPETEKNLIY